MDVSYISSLAATVQHRTSLKEFVSYGGSSGGGHHVGGTDSLLHSTSPLYLQVHSSLNVVMKQIGSPYSTLIYNDIKLHYSTLR